MEFSLVYFSQKKFKFSAATCEIFFRGFDVQFSKSTYTLKCRLKLGGFKSKLGSFERVEKNVLDATAAAAPFLLPNFSRENFRMMRYSMPPVIHFHIKKNRVISVVMSTTRQMVAVLLSTKQFSREEIQLISRLQAIFAPLNTE